MSTGLQPDPAQTEQVIQILKQSQSSDNKVQKQVHESLANLQSNPEFNGYLAHVFAFDTPSVDRTIRCSSGILLKNNCFKYFEQFSGVIKSIIVESMFEAMGDPFAIIRSTAGSLLSSVVRADQFNCWLDVIYPNLRTFLNTPVDNAVKAEGCLMAIQRVLEDYDGNINENIGMDCAVEILHKCGQLCQHPDANLRFVSSECFATLLYNSVRLDETSLKHLFAVANDLDYRIRKNVCKCLVIIVHREIEALFPCFAEFLQYILERVNDETEEVAIEACEVWSALADQPYGRDLMEPCIDKLAPLLLSKMKYTEEDPAMIAINLAADDDSYLDICAETRNRRTALNIDSDDSGDEGGGAGMAGCPGGNIQWNLRKGAAFTLDQLSHIFSNLLLPCLLPSLQSALVSDDWLTKESAILALGAISEGCYDSMIVYMHEIMPFIFSCLDDPQPLVRSISCWSAGRYCSWIVHQEDPSFLNQIVALFVHRLSDPNARVQEAACSAMSILQEEAGSKLAPYVPQIVAAFTNALSTYQARNQVMLYDTIGILIDSTRGCVDAKTVIEPLAPILIQMLDRSKDDDSKIFSLFECLTSMASASSGDPAFLQTIEFVFHRCSVLLQKYLHEQVECEHRQCRFSDSDFIVVPLDTIASLISTLGDQAQPICARYHIMAILMLHLVENKIPEIRQSALALIGDLAKACIAVVNPELAKLVPFFKTSIDAHNFVAIRNNAIWAFGEVVANLPENEAGAYVEPLVTPIVGVMTTRLCQKALADNTAITIGKICLKCPQKIIHLLDQFIHIWFRVMCGVHDKSAKEQALLGMCRALKLNPSSLLSNFLIFCEAIVSFRSEPQHQLKQILQEILDSYKLHVGEEQWIQFKTSLDPGLLQQLTKEYSM